MNKNNIDAALNFNPSDVGAVNGNLFGLPFTYEQANVVIIPVPWEVTVSYRAGTALGPQAVLEASPQLDLYHFDYPDAWKKGLYMLPVNQTWYANNKKYRQMAAGYIKSLEEGQIAADNESLQQLCATINKACTNLKNEVHEQCKNIIADNKIVGILGGDHSTPLGLIEALGEQYNDFGILQIDAHADLRESYEDFTYSHASIMYNALKCKQVSKLVSVGVRDICHDEIAFTEQAKGRIVAYYDYAIKKEVYLEQTKTWANLCQEIVANLPQLVYLSFDIDGLDPKLCPNTGTPVMGGLQWHEAQYLIKCVKDSGRRIIGFDLCEVGVNDSNANEDWDANVGARVLWEIIANL